MANSVDPDQTAPEVCICHFVSNLVYETLGHLPKSSLIYSVGRAYCFGLVRLSVCPSVQNIVSKISRKLFELCH